jgi:Cys-tRNA(Pro)/Cys-tRNA(Cys) deacylase
MTQIKKTQSMRVLEGQGVPYEVITFPEIIHDASEVAIYADVPVYHVYKTLVVEAAEPGFKPMLVMIAADRRLDLRKMAAVAGVKKAAMAPQRDAERLTGLKVGGISALALLNRGFLVYIDEWATLLDFVLVSAGQRGVNLRLPTADLIRITGAEIADVSEDL